MCGIAGLLLSPGDLQRVSVDDMIKTLGLEIESRGRDATGVARLTSSNRLRVAKNPCKATDFFMKHPQIGDGCRLALVHTRAATHGDPKDSANNHPITSGPITGIHNGIVSNDDALFRRYSWNRVADVDSEAIFTAIHNLGWKEAMELLSGSIACAWHDMEKPGHLFVARHTSNPLHIGISESGSVIFASTNAAVAKAAAVLGSTKIEIDQIKEGVMCEFWTDEEGVLKSNVEEFTPPKSFHSRAGAWEYEQGAWFPRGSRSTVVTGSAARGAASSPTAPTSSYGSSAWGLGAEGWVLRKGDGVVFEPKGAGFEPMFGEISHFGAKQDHVWVEFAYDEGLADELCLPLSQLWPVNAYRATLKAVGREPIALPPPPPFPPTSEPHDLTDEDFYCPRSTEDLVAAIEEIFGKEALDLIPGFHEWERGELDSWVFPDIDDDVIDVEEVSTDG